MKSKHTFSVDDIVILFDKKQREYMFSLKYDGVFESHLGNMHHSELIGQSEGTWVCTKTGHWLLAFKPTKSDFTLNMKRIATIIYPKDLAHILLKSNISLGSRVVEAGSGSGALSIALSEAVGLDGKIYSYDIRKDMSDIASKNLETYSSGNNNVEFKIGDVADRIYETEIDSIILDLPEPWHVIDNACESLAYGGTIVTFLPTIMQVSDFVNKLKTNLEFAYINTTELIERPWEVGGRSVRPSHRMVGHTGFITSARKCRARPDKDLN
jgi:tRNA (adenine57-N1/adenine58-N1)-methyltransferase